MVAIVYRNSDNLKNGVSAKQCSFNHFRLCEQLLKYPFTACHTLLSPEVYITRCQTDICNCYGDHACSGVFCSAAANYASDCASALELHDQRLTSWRDHVEVCTEICPVNEIWSTASCSLAETCESISVPASCSKPIEGCQCKPGFYRSSGGICIPQASCGCYDKTGMILAAGESRFENGRACRCQSGRIRCQSSELGEELSRKQRNLEMTDAAGDDCNGENRMLVPENSAKMCGQTGDIDSVEEVCACRTGWFDPVQKICVESEADCSCDQMNKPKTTLCSDFKCKDGKWIEKRNGA